MDKLHYADLVGTKFANHGRTVESGLDCYGLVKEMFRRSGKALPEFDADYDDTKKISGIIKGEQGKSTWRRIQTEAGETLPVPCLIALRFGVPKPYVNHTAVYVGEGLFLHTRENIGVCVDRLANPAWRKVIEGYYVYEG